MSTLTSYEPLVEATIEEFLTQTQKRFADKEASCDFARWLQYFAFDVIGELTWSKRLGFLERFEDVDGIVENLADFLAYAAPVSQTSRVSRKGNLSNPDANTAPPSRSANNPGSTGPSATKTP